MNTKKMEKEMESKIQEQRKNIPKEVSQEIMKKIFINLLKAISIMFYFVIINLAYVKIDIIKLTQYIEIFSGLFLLLGLIQLERAYKKDSGTIAITGIELLFLSFYTLSIIHITTLLKYDFRFYVLTFSYIFSIYYVLKCIIIYTKERRKYLESLSDISDIVREDEPIKKEAKKRRNKSRELQKESQQKDSKEKKDIKPKSVKRGKRKK